MILNHCFKLRSLVLGAVLIIGLGHVTHAKAHESYFLVDLNSKTVTELGTLGGNSTLARDVNDAGQVVGESKKPGGDWHAFITGPDRAGMRDLGTLGGEHSFADDINDAGQVVGTSRTAEGGVSAFITGPDGEGMMDLNSVVDLPNGVFLTRAEAINNAGQVLAAGVIPEPQGYAMLLAGLGLIGFMTRRKKADNGV